MVDIPKALVARGPARETPVADGYVDHHPENAGWMDFRASDTEELYFFF